MEDTDKDKRISPKELRDLVDEANELAQIFDLPPILSHDILDDPYEDSWCSEYTNTGIKIYK